MVFWRAGFRAIRPEDSSMIRALADLLAYLFPISACKADLLRTGLIRRS